MRAMSTGGHPGARARPLPKPPESWCVSARIFFWPAAGSTHWCSHSRHPGRYPTTSINYIDRADTGGGVRQAQAYIRAPSKTFTETSRARAQRLCFGPAAGPACAAAGSTPWCTHNRHRRSSECVAFSTEPTLTTLPALMLPCAPFGACAFTGPRFSHSSSASGRYLPLPVLRTLILTLDRDFLTLLPREPYILSFRPFLTLRG